MLHIKSPNRRLVYELRPGTYASSVIQTNAAGFRDGAFVKEKSEGVFRIVVVGDSITFGWGVRLESTYHKALAAILNAQCPGELRFEVYAMGVGGYNAGQELELVRSKALAYDPDLVLMQYCVNDDEIGADSGLWEHFAQTPFKSLDFVRLRLATFKTRLPGQNPVSRSYAALAHIAKERGVPFAVALFPDLNPSTAPIRARAAEFEGMGIPSAYLGEAFCALGMDHLIYDGYVHPNALGHRIAAEEIHRFLLREELLPANPKCTEASKQWEEARRHVAAAFEAYGKGDVAALAAAYGAAVGAAPGYAGPVSEVLAATAADYLKSGLSAQALVAARAASTLDEANPFAWVRLGDAQLANGAAAEATAAYERALALGVRDVGLQAGLATALARCGHVESAMPHFRHALEGSKNLAGHFSQVLEEAGTTALAKGQWHAAETAFEAAVAFSPSVALSAATLLERAAVRQMTDDEPSSALALYESAVRFAPERCGADLVKAALERGRLSEAIKAGAISEGLDASTLLAAVEEPEAAIGGTGGQTSDSGCAGSVARVFEAKAQEVLAGGDWRQARKLMRAALVFSPEAAGFAAQLFESAGDTLLSNECATGTTEPCLRAAQLFAVAASFRPENPTPLLYQAQALAKAGALDEIPELVARAAQEGAVDSQGTLLHELALHWAGAAVAGDWPRACACAMVAAEVAPEAKMVAERWLALSQSHPEMGEAFRAFHQAVGELPACESVKEVAVWFAGEQCAADVVEVALNQGRLSDAIRVAAKVVGLDAFALLAAVEKPGESLGGGQRSDSGCAGSMAGVFTAKAQGVLADGDWQQARKLMCAALAFSPESAGFAAQLFESAGDTLLYEVHLPSEREHYLRVAQLFAEAASFRPEYPALLLRQAQALAKAGVLDDIPELIARASEGDAADNLYLVLDELVLGWAKAAAAGNWERACAFVAVAAEIAPEPRMLAIRWLMLRQSHPEMARDFRAFCQAFGELPACEGVKEVVRHLRLAGAG